MALATVATRALVGIDAPPVTVEVHLAGGLPAMTIVGMAETAVKESRDRVRSAILNSFLEFPVGRITVNLAPADLPKSGGRFDLAIALGILVASGQVPASAMADSEAIGELSLSGDLQRIGGVLPAAAAARKAGRQIILPSGNADEVALLPGETGFAATDLVAVVGHLRGNSPLPPIVHREASEQPGGPCLSDLRGQPEARLALEVAAAGGHNLMVFGPPGTGKSMLASRLPGILPPLSADESLEVATIQSVCGLPVRWGQRPYRAPHHSCSGAALVGGGRNAAPGEVTLAHRGVLFLDEMTEFQRHTLDVLREPLESGEVTISRAARQNRYPAEFQLIGAFNPTPSGDSVQSAVSNGADPKTLQRYLSRLSGPLLDRMDLFVEMPVVSPDVLQAREAGEASDSVRERVVSARNRQLKRQGYCNAALPIQSLMHAAFDNSAMALLASLTEHFGLSARAQHRVLRVSRTIADLRAADIVAESDLAQAMQLRQLDRLSV